jgi:hypothetical protein
MTSEPTENQTNKPSSKAIKAAAREKRLKAALRDNLHRRKGQTRTRNSTEQASETTQEE